MVPLRLLLALAGTGIGASSAADRPTLAPGKILRFDFPELPPSLQSMSRGLDRSPQMTVRLPDNYTLDGRFPLFIYQTGGAGGNGDELELGLATIGPRNFVVANLPLFKAVWNKNGPAGGLLVTSEDYATIARCYGTMLRRLEEAVPNLTTEGSVFGGHSNGAHTTAVLLLDKNPDLIRRFPAFFLHEGGTRLIAAPVLDESPLREAPLLLMMGGNMPGSAPPTTPAVAPPAPGISAPPPANPRTAAAQRLVERIDSLQQSRGSSFTFVRMAGYGHEQPPEYLALIGQWARGEPLTDVPAKIARLVAALPLPLHAHPDVSEWPDLPNADLSTHRLPPGKVWTYREGILTCADDQPIWTRRDYVDCVLDFEFKPEPGARGGVFVYNSDAEKWRSAAVEISLGDDTPDPTQPNPPRGRTGSFVGRQAPSASAAVAPGRWNRATIACQGPNLTVLINGTEVNRIDLSRGAQPANVQEAGPDAGKQAAAMPTKGRIGLQARQGGSAIEFRNLKLLRLDPGASERM
jgi:hypothetical protein